MNLLRFPLRETHRTVKVDGRHGTRKVKVRISDNQVVQHVEDTDVQHATVCPDTIGVRKTFRTDQNTGLWLPLER